MDLGLYKGIARPVLFVAQPETAHNIAKWFFRRSWLWRLLRWGLRVEDDRLRVTVGHLSLPNPVGLAAGFDKDCEMSRALFDMGFGYLTLGTVTSNPREGNPKPRVWRYPEQCLINSMGLPSQGARRIAARLSGHKIERSGPVIVSVSGLSVEEFVACYRQIEAWADGVELNISSPNTEGVRIFQQPDVLSKLLEVIAGVRSHGKPLWVKIPPYFNERERDNVLGLVDICLQKAVDGITATNTKLVKEPRAAIGTGGLSGPLIYEDMIRIVADIHTYTRGKISINACGGINSGLKAWRALELGASSVQLYTALVYEGPGVVSRINRDLLLMLESSKLNSFSQVTGRGLH